MWVRNPGLCFALALLWHTSELRITHWSLFSFLFFSVYFSGGKLNVQTGVLESVLAHKESNLVPLVCALGQIT